MTTDCSTKTILRNKFCLNVCASCKEVIIKRLNRKYIYICFERTVVYILISGRAGNTHPTLLGAITLPSAGRKKVAFQRFDRGRKPNFRRDKKTYFHTANMSHGVVYSIESVVLLSATQLQFMLSQL